MLNFVQNWFRINTKFMRNFVQKIILCKNTKMFAREFTVSWKP